MAVDTCGGCSSKGASGSASQRAALILSDGPPQPLTGDVNSTDPIVEKLEFTGDSHSHNFPSVAQVNIEVIPTSDDNVVIVALSSSDGSGGTSNATFAGNGKWIVHQPIFMGTGWGAKSDPFTLLDQQRSLIISSDQSTATYQDMGADFTLRSTSLPPEDEAPENEEDDESDGGNSTTDETSDAESGGTALSLSSFTSFYWGSLMLFACGAAYLAM